MIAVTISSRPGAGLEAAMRRDLSGAIQTGLDQAAFLGTGADGQPLGLLTTPATYSITETAVDAAATWAAFRAAAVRFMLANAASGPGEARLMIRPEIWSALDGAIFDAGSGITEWDRLSSQMGAAVVTSNALAAPTGSPLASSAVLTTTGDNVMERLTGRSTLSAGNIRNAHFYLRDFVSAFPPEVIGGSNTESRARRTVTIDWGGASPAITDIDGTKRIFRRRGWIRSFFERTGAREGDAVVIEQMGAGSYRVRLERGGA